MIFSFDGTGHRWPVQKRVWLNARRKNGFVIDSNNSEDIVSTCGYTGIAEIAPGKALLVFSTPSDPYDQSVDNPWDIEKRKKMTIWMVSFDTNIENR